MNEPVASLVDLAADIRALTEQMIRIPSLPEDAEREVRAVREHLQALTETLLPHAPADRVPRGPEGPDHQRPFFFKGVFLGDHHPHRQEVTIEHEAGRTRGTATFGITFEGPPGCVHGGYLAHFFDQVLGQHNLFEKIPAMTGSLTIRYRRSAPLLTPLRFEAWHESLGDRKVKTSGFLADGDEIVCEAEGIFIVPRTAAWLDEHGRPGSTTS